MLSLLFTFVTLLAAGVVVIEGFNKLERTEVRRRDKTLLEWLSAWLRAAAWTCFVLSAAGLVFAGDMDAAYLRVGYTLAVLGTMFMVIRSRVREYIKRPSLHEADGFERTQVVRHHQV